MYIIPKINVAIRKGFFILFCEKDLPKSKELLEEAYDNRFNHEKLSCYNEDQEILKVLLKLT